VLKGDDVDVGVGGYDFVWRRFGDVEWGWRVVVWVGKRMQGREEAKIFWWGKSGGYIDFPATFLYLPPNYQGVRGADRIIKAQKSTN